MYRGVIEHVTLEHPFEVCVKIKFFLPFLI